MIHLLYKNPSHFSNEVQPKNVWIVFFCQKKLKFTAQKSIFRHRKVGGCHLKKKRKSLQFQNSATVFNQEFCQVPFAKCPLIQKMENNKDKWKILSNRLQAIQRAVQQETTRQAWRLNSAGKKVESKTMGPKLNGNRISIYQPNDWRTNLELTKNSAGSREGHVKKGQWGDRSMKEVKRCHDPEKAKRNGKKVHEIKEQFLRSPADQKRHKKVFSYIDLNNTN